MPSRSAAEIHFGHGTRRGNELIVRNLIETVFEPLFGG
jgi:hypothetical protein